MPGTMVLFFVDGILKGTRPAEMPVARPARFELGVNLTTANTLGRSLPPLVLARVDRTIE